MMPMTFKRIDHALGVCKKHLDATGTRNTPIESCLVGYLLTIIYAEYETIIHKIVVMRVTKTTASDADLHRFIEPYIKYRTGKIKISDVWDTGKIWKATKASVP
jgi:hypothetical protein